MKNGTRPWPPPAWSKEPAAAALSRTHTHPRPAEMAKKGTSPSFSADEKKQACVPSARARVPAWQPLAARARPAQPPAVPTPARPPPPPPLSLRRPPLLTRLAG